MYIIFTPTPFCKNIKKQGLQIINNYFPLISNHSSKFCTNLLTSTNPSRTSLIINVSYNFKQLATSCLTLPCPAWTFPSSKTLCLTVLKSFFLSNFLKNFTSVDKTCIDSCTMSCKIKIKINSSVWETYYQIQSLTQFHFFQQLIWSHLEVDKIDPFSSNSSQHIS